MSIVTKAKNKKHPTAITTGDMLHHQAFDNSFQPNIISIVSNGKIIMANSASCKLLGYSKKELLTKKRSAIFDIDESNFKKMLKERTAEGHSIALVTIIKKSGKRVPCEITSAIFMGEEGIEKSITTIADRSQSLLKQKNIDTKKEKVVADNIVLAISKQKNIDIKKEKVVAGKIILAVSKQKNIDAKKEKIVADNIMLGRAEYEESLKMIFTSSSDILYDCNLVADEILISNAFEKEFGYKITRHMTPEKDWISHIHPDDKEAAHKDYLRMLASEDIEWKYSYRFLRADDSVADVLSSAIVLRNAAGKAFRTIGSMQDISKQRVLEESFTHEIKLREKQIAEAMEEAADMARSDIGKELHDNINQLLTASRMYLLMAKGGGNNSEMYINRSSEYTLMAIEEIRKLTRGLITVTVKNLGLCEAIENIVRDTMEISPVKISYDHRSFIENSVTDKFKLNVLRIVQEQLNNILKHAKATEISISLSQDEKATNLTISDNGVGFDTNQKQKGIGLNNIKSRAASFGGTADTISQPGHGCVLTVTLPRTVTSINGALLSKASGVLPVFFLMLSMYA